MGGYLWSSKPYNPAVFYAPYIYSYRPDSLKTASWGGSVKSLQASGVHTAEEAFIINEDTALLMCFAWHVHVHVESVKAFGDFHCICIVDTFAPIAVVRIARSRTKNIIVFCTVVVDDENAIDGCSVERYSRYEMTCVFEYLPKTKCCGCNDSCAALSQNMRDGVGDSSLNTVGRQTNNTLVGHTAAQTIDFGTPETFSFLHRNDNNK